MSCQPDAIVTGAEFTEWRIFRFIDGDGIVLPKSCGDVEGCLINALEKTEGRALFLDALTLSSPTKTGGINYCVIGIYGFYQAYSRRLELG